MRKVSASVDGGGERLVSKRDLIHGYNWKKRSGYYILFIKNIDGAAELDYI